MAGNFDLENYQTVQERIGQFYQDFPDGNIQVHILRLDGPEVIIEARVYRSRQDVIDGVYTSDLAREIEGKTPVNRTSHIENCSTSAQGRALAALGYAPDARRPSRAEMIKVARMKEEHEQMLQYIRTAGPKVKADAEIEIAGEKRALKDYVREYWPAIKEQFRIARLVVDAMEAATGIPFGAEGGQGDGEGNPPPPPAQGRTRARTAA